MDTEPDEDRGVRDANLYFCATLCWRGVQKVVTSENGTTILVACDDPSAPAWEPEKRAKMTVVKANEPDQSPDEFDDFN
jgi:hypothetical protein